MAKTRKRSDPPSIAELAGRCAARGVAQVEAAVDAETEDQKVVLLTKAEQSLRVAMLLQKVRIL